MYLVAPSPKTPMILLKQKIYLRPNGVSISSRIDWPIRLENRHDPKLSLSVFFWSPRIHSLYKMDIPVENTLWRGVTIFGSSIGYRDLPINSYLMMEHRYLRQTQAYREHIC